MTRMLQPHEYGWRHARLAETHESHSTTEMRLVSGKGPLWFWSCTHYQCARRGGFTRTLASAETPVCGGGMKWSFTTKARDD